MKSKIALFFDTDISAGGAYSEAIYILSKLEKIKKDYDVEIVILFSSKESKKLFLNNESKSIFFNLNIFQRYVCYLRNFNNIIRKIKKFFFQNKFENFLKKNHIDIVYFVNPSQYSLYLEDTDFIINVPDVSHRENIEFPEWAKSNNFAWRENILSRTLIRAIAVITNAEIIKKKIIKFYGVEDQRIIIVNQQPSLSVSEFNLNIQKVNNDYDLPKDYIFYPANFLPHKNHKYIIDVIHLMKSRKHNLSAVFCGSDKGYLNVIKRYVSRLDLEKEIIFLDYVSEKDLPLLYIKSLALVMPTFSGPTNIPPWEAFSLKVPVIYSDIFNIREVYKDAVYYINPFDPYTTVDAIENLMKNFSYKKKLIENGTKLLKSNNFEKEIKQIFEIIENHKKIKNSWLFN